MASAESPRLPRDQWLEVVARAPLVSIDLILRDADNRVLLGLRRNEPARDCWFVPGGVIRKNERLDQAFRRISLDELGLDLRRADARQLGVYEHHYASNFVGVAGVGTHYVVLAHEIQLATLPLIGPLDQHADLRAYTIPDLLAAADVHENTKAYFR